MSPIFTDDLAWRMLKLKMYGKRPKILKTLFHTLIFAQLLFSMQLFLKIFSEMGNSLDSGSVITKTRLYNFDPRKPHFYIVKLGFTGVYIIFS